jgi:hypothetical protein
VSRSFSPALDELIYSLTFSTFSDDECGYSGYYCPGLGISIARHHLGRIEFETSMVHEVLHAVYFHDLVDEDAFARTLERLRADPDYPGFVNESTATGWQGFVYFLFEQSEYFARVGDEIVRRRGINVPPYLWDIYRGILHARIEEHGRQYAESPFPENADVQLSDTRVERRTLVQHALGIPSAHDATLPRRDVLGFAADMSIPFNEPAQSPITVIFSRRSDKQHVATCSAAPVMNGIQRRLRCFWNPDQARAILTAWIDYDLVIEVVDPMLAMNRR